MERLAACAQVNLEDGETIVSICCGGGGYGAPTERAAEQVAHDVAEGWISEQRAHDIYRVVLDSSGKVDVAETTRLRSAA